MQALDTLEAPPDLFDGRDPTTSFHVVMLDPDVSDAADVTAILEVLQAVHSIAGLGLLSFEVMSGCEAWVTFVDAMEKEDFYRMHQTVTVKGKSFIFLDNGDDGSASDGHSTDIDGALSDSSLSLYRTTWTKQLPVPELQAPPNSARWHQSDMLLSDPRYHDTTADAAVDTPTRATAASGRKRSKTGHVLDLMPPGTKGPDAVSNRIAAPSGHSHAFLPDRRLSLGIPLGSRAAPEGDVRHPTCTMARGAGVRSSASTGSGDLSPFSLLMFSQSSFPSYSPDVPLAAPPAGPPDAAAEDRSGLQPDSDAAGGHLQPPGPGDTAPTQRDAPESAPAEGATLRRAGLTWNALQVPPDLQAGSQRRPRRSFDVSSTKARKGSTTLKRHRTGSVDFLGRTRKGSGPWLVTGPGPERQQSTLRAPPMRGSGQRAPQVPGTATRERRPPTLRRTSLPLTKVDGEKVPESVGGMGQ